MKFFNAIAAAAFVGSALATAAPANAGFTTPEGIHLMDESDFSAPYHDLVRVIYAAGVPIIDGGKNKVKACSDNHGGMLMGFYSSTDNVMVLCTQNNYLPGLSDDKYQARYGIPRYTDRENAMDHTLSHEATHLLQDLTAGLGNPSIAPAMRLSVDRVISEITKLPDSDRAKKVDEMTSLYPQHKWDTELEARWYEGYPGTQVTKIKKALSLSNKLSAPISTAAVNHYYKNDLAQKSLHTIGSVKSIELSGSACVQHHAHSR